MPSTFIHQALFINHSQTQKILILVLSYYNLDIRSPFGIIYPRVHELLKPLQPKQLIQAIKSAGNFSSPQYRSEE